MPINSAYESIAIKLDLKPDEVNGDDLVEAIRAIPGRPINWVSEEWPVELREQVAGKVGTLLLNPGVADRHDSLSAA